MSEASQPHLGFSDAVKRSFAFLRNYGFRLAEETPTSLKYVSPTVSALIYREPYSFEMGVMLTLFSDETCTVELKGIVDYGGAPEASEFRERTMFQTSSIEGVQHLVPEMARLVREYGEPFLTGNTDAFAAAEKAKAVDWSNLMATWRLQDVRSKVAFAWQHKNYAEVAALLRPIRELLTESELMKLAYAERNLNTLRDGNS